MKIGFFYSFNVWVAQALFAVVALMWFIPDRRIEKRVTSSR